MSVKYLNNVILSVTATVILLPSVRAWCIRDDRNGFNENTRGCLSRSAALAISIIIPVGFVLLMALLCFMRRRRIQRANLAYVHNAQAAAQPGQGQYYNSQQYNPQPWNPQQYNPPQFNGDGYSSGYPQAMQYAPPPGPPPGVEGYMTYPQDTRPPHSPYSPQYPPPTHG
ncbi:hypothetical protein PLICRDRAFT_172063 [Plicaturopsis crispa FD-325 SS-3]|nr:hypothetical protein PLICRDRAFT_172063 [Plicaturopsis crispa FD-325 SS-3]